MSLHNFYDHLKRAPLPSGASVTGQMFNTPLGYLLAYGNTVPSDAAVGYAPGCIFIQTDGVSQTTTYLNVGTKASADFDSVSADVATYIAANNLTLATGKTLTITDADKLIVNSIIVPTSITVPIDLWSHASLTTRNLFYASGLAWTVQAIIYEPEITEGTGSVVCTVCKVTGNNVAVAATTPMCTAFAVTGTAGTPVVATLTGTVADLALAATEKIGCIFSGGDNFLDTGRGRLFIRMKRS